MNKTVALLDDQREPVSHQFESQQNENLPDYGHQNEDILHIAQSASGKESSF